MAEADWGSGVSGPGPGEGEKSQDENDNIPQHRQGVNSGDFGNLENQHQGNDLQCEDPRESPEAEYDAGQRGGIAACLENENVLSESAEADRTDECPESSVGRNPFPEGDNGLEDSPERDNGINQLPEGEMGLSTGAHHLPTHAESNCASNRSFKNTVDNDVGLMPVGYCEPEADHVLRPPVDGIDGNIEENYMPEDEISSYDDSADDRNIACEDTAAEADMILHSQSEIQRLRSESADDLETADMFPEDDELVDGLKLFGNIQGGEAAPEEDRIPCNITPSARHVVSVDEQHSLPEDDLTVQTHSGEITSCDSVAHRTQTVPISGEIIVEQNISNNDSSCVGTLNQEKHSVNKNTLTKEAGGEIVHGASCIQETVGASSCSAEQKSQLSMNRNMQECLLATANNSESLNTGDSASHLKISPMNDHANEMENINHSSESGNINNHLPTETQNSDNSNKIHIHAPNPNPPLSKCDNKTDSCEPECDQSSSNNSAVLNQGTECSEQRTQDICVVSGNMQVSNSLCGDSQSVFEKSKPAYSDVAYGKTDSSPIEDVTQVNNSAIRGDTNVTQVNNKGDTNVTQVNNRGDINVTIRGDINVTQVNADCNTVKSLSSGGVEQIPQRIPHSTATSREISASRLDEELLSELDEELTGTAATSQNTTPNGIVQLDRSNFTEWREIKTQLHKATDLAEDREMEIERLKDEKRSQGRQLQTALKERDSYLREVQHLRSTNTDDLYIPQIKELEFTIARQQAEIRSVKEKLASHDAAAKRAVSTLQHECKLRLDQVTKMYEDATREKDSMVVKYAQAEQKHLEFQKMSEKLDNRVKEVTREKEAILERAKAIKAERNKLAGEMEMKMTETNSLMKEVEKQKDATSSLDVRIKWAQNKLKLELEGHKETKKLLDQTNLKLKEAKEETDQIRRDCQRMIKTYQESEEIKSNSLDQKLKAKESELKMNLKEKSSQEEVYTNTIRELEALRVQHRESITELGSMRGRMQSLESDKMQTEQQLEKVKAVSQKRSVEITGLQSRIEELIHLQEDFNRAQNVIQTLDKEISELRISNKDLQSDMEACRVRETEKLELTSRLSRKNAELQSDNTNVSNKVMYLTSEIETQKMELQEMDTKYRDLSDKLQDVEKKWKEETDSLNKKLSEKTKLAESLAVKLEEEKDDIKTLKRKHVNNVKDLTRQLQQSKRKLEMYECSGEKDTTSLGSRTSSNGSLNTVGLATDSASPPRPAVIQSINPAIRPPSQEQDHTVITEPFEINKQVLIERIVRLQRAHARKNEKIEFMEDHINQLVNQVQKKSRIIQNYILREETGTLTPDFMDYNKVCILSRKHSIMGSLYSSHATDGTMTLDLSLEINRKLQAVLEDTLLKNITLKENLDTLGTEIARLSQENRRIQLQIHDKMKVKR
ncbi:hypothetical protein ScPMuIL_001660 [Solemya velum]